MPIRIGQANTGLHERPARPISEALTVVTAFTIVSIVATWPLAAHLTDTLPSDLGDPLLNVWTLGWVADRLAHGLGGFWDAPIFFPYTRTLASTEHLLGIGLFTAPVQWLTGNELLAYNLAFIGSYVLAAGGMYLLARSVWGRRDVAILAALAFAFGPHRVAQMPHLQVLMSGWMPIGLWALHRYFVSGSRWALAAFASAFVLNGLSNGYFLFFYLLPVAALAAFELWHRRPLARRTVLELVAAALFIMACIAPIAVGYRAARAEHGYERSFGETVAFSANLASYLNVSNRLHLWPRVLDSSLPALELFPGLTMLALAVAALWPRRRTGRPPEGCTRSWPPGTLALFAAVAAIALVFSLGPRPAAGNITLPTGPYDWLRAAVPLLDGLRVPARMSIVVYLALAVLAAGGAARLLAGRSRSHRSVIVLLLASAILAEGWAVPIPVEEFRPVLNSGDEAAYRWLRRSPQGGVIELPLGPWSGLRTLRYQYNTLLHGHAIVNGYSGYGSSLQAFLLGPVLRPPNLDEAVRMFRVVGIRYIVVHGAEYDTAEEAHDIISGFRRAKGQIVGQRGFGQTVIFELADAPPRQRAGDGNLQRIPRSAFRATTSHARLILGRAFDGNPESRWLSGRAQKGDEWVQLAFDRPREIAEVRIGMTRRSWGDYPRNLVIESKSPDGQQSILFDGSVLSLIADGLVRGDGRGSFSIHLPPNRTDILCLRQTASTRTWFWSIHEIDIWERASPQGVTGSDIHYFLDPVSQRVIVTGGLGLLLFSFSHRPGWKAPHVQFALTRLFLETALH